jgi:hypothetical protein
VLRDPAVRRAELAALMAKAASILMIVVGVVLLLHGLCGGFLWWLLSLNDERTHPWPLHVLYLGSFVEALRRPSKGPR